jgi:hypothetical protein
VVKPLRMKRSDVEGLVAYGDQHGGDALLELFRHCLEPKEAGAPRKWRSYHVLHVWVAIEAERYKLKTTNVERAVKSLLGSKGVWHAHVDEENEFTIKSIRRGRELHTEGKKLLKRNTRAAQWAKRMLKAAKHCIDDGWHVKVTRELVGGRRRKILITRRRVNTLAGRVGERP